MQRKKEELERTRQTELEKARTEARNLTARTRAQAEALLEELENQRKKQDAADTAEARAALRAGLKAMENQADPVEKKTEEAYKLPRPLKKGDRVLIYDIDKNAIVVTPPDKSGMTEVQAGIIKTRVPVKNLRLIQNDAVSVPTGTKNGPVRKPRNVTKELSRSSIRTEVDLRGMTADEALLELDRFIDGAVLSGVNMISIIHGKGTGVLRNAVNQRLRSHPNIRTFRLGVYGEGENGVTIAELK
jgi:DNA mismatch repair protein MutS2